MPTILQIIRAMPNLLDLANELVLAIASHIPRSPDKFQLALINHKLYDLIIPELYKHILLDQTSDPASKEGLAQIKPHQCWDAVRLRRLCDILINKPHSRRLLVESLRLELRSDILHESLALSNITQYLPRLKSLYLSSTRSASRNLWAEPSWMSPSMLKHRLRDVKETLESLVIDIDQDIHFRDGTAIGGFRQFHALKHLGIQSHVLLNEHEDHLYYCQSDESEIQGDAPSLVAILPPGLQRLQMSCWTDRDKEYERSWGQVIALLLGSLMEWGLEDVPELQDIIVYYPVKHDGVRDVQKYDELNFKQCVMRRRWQEVAKMLTEMALKEHRNISVKYKQGSEKGSRSWGEAATEPAKVGS